MNPTQCQKHEMIQKDAGENISDKIYYDRPKYETEGKQKFSISFTSD